MSLASKIVTAGRLLVTDGLGGLLREIPERLDRSTGKVTRHPHLNPISVEVSVVVPTFNGGSDLRALLQSLSEQTGCRLEVLVLDSGSTDGSRELAKGFPQVRWVDIPTAEFNHSTTRNLGVELARFPLVFLTVQDAVLPETDWINRFAALFEQEKLGALAAAETPRPDADAYARYSLDSHYRGLRLAEATTLIHRRWTGARRERIRAASIGNVGCLYRRDLLLEYPFEGSFGEDFTLAMRLLKDRIPVGKTRELQVVHSHTRPAFYSLKRMAVSRRLMTDLDLTRPEEDWTEEKCLGLVSALAGFFGEGWATVMRLDPRLMAWVEAMGADLLPVVPPHQTLVDIVKEVEPYAELNTVERTTLVLKALAGRIGWVLGGIDSSLWSTEARKIAVEGLANGV